MRFMPADHPCLLASLWARLYPSRGCEGSPKVVLAKMFRHVANDKDGVDKKGFGVEIRSGFRPKSG